MNWKGPALVLVLLLAILAVSTVLRAPQKTEAPPPVQPFAFSLSVNGFSVVDSGNGAGVRAAVTLSGASTSAGNATAEIIALAVPPRSQIYEVTNYPEGDDKNAIADAIASGLAPYGVKPVPLTLDEAMVKKNSVIILPSSAIPSKLAAGGILDLLDGNTVIFFGRPLDLAVDESGAQTLMNESAYSVLGVSRDVYGDITPESGGPARLKAGNATVLNYDHGSLVLYDDPSDAAVGNEIAGLILREGWQPGRAYASFALPADGGNWVRTFYSPQAAAGNYSVRVLYNASDGKNSSIGVMDLAESDKLPGTLGIPDLSGTGKALPYSFELHDASSYPVYYEMSLQFVRDGAVVDTEGADAVTIKTIAIDSGTAHPNISAGSYTVKLMDQYGNVHAVAYTHVPEVHVKLVRIEGDDHVFYVTVDGLPAAIKTGTLTVNDADRFQMNLDKNGEARIPFVLAPGTYKFTAEVGGESGTTYYVKQGEAVSMVSVVFLLGGGFLAFVLIFRSREERKWAIRTSPRLPSRPKSLSVPYDSFLDIFRMTQRDRAPGMPLTISDLRLGMRKHAAYKGAPLFVTDSNLYGVLHEMVKKKRFLTYDGYFLPADMAEGNPIEYHVMKRRLSDRFLESGLEMKPARGADFTVNGRFVHLWTDLDPKKLLTLSKRSENIILMPDAARKSAFLRMAQRYDPAWMKLSLAVQYGKISCWTMDEFMERGFGAKN